MMVMMIYMYIVYDDIYDGGQVCGGGIDNIDHHPQRQRCHRRNIRWWLWWRGGWWHFTPWGFLSLSWGQHCHQNSLVIGIHPKEVANVWQKCVKVVQMTGRMMTILTLMTLMPIINHLLFIDHHDPWSSLTRMTILIKKQNHDSVKKVTIIIKVRVWWSDHPFIIGKRRIIMMIISISDHHLPSQSWLVRQHC